MARAKKVTRYYTGPHRPGVHMVLDGEPIDADYGKAVKVTAAQAEVLDARDDWSTTAPKAATDSGETSDSAGKSDLDTQEGDA